VDIDETLVAQAATGNREAFDELVRRYHSRIFQLVSILTSGDADAEDLVQDTFVRAYRAVGQFRGESTFRTWLHRIAVNVVRTHAARRSSRGDRRPPRYARDASPDTGYADEPSDIGSVASAEDLENDVVRRRMIDQALARLPPDVRLLITLRDVQGLEYREISLITGLPIGTVESRLFRGRRRIRPMLEPLLAKCASSVTPKKRKSVL
jgi:RNA polymerase sigma-70 factor, ECF subfamily